VRLLWRRRSWAHGMPFRGTPSELRTLVASCNRAGFSPRLPPSFVAQPFGPELRYQRLARPRIPLQKLPQPDRTTRLADIGLQGAIRTHRDVFSYVPVKG
jgi:hypothetical protein